LVYCRKTGDADFLLVDVSTGAQRHRIVSESAKDTISWRPPYAMVYSDADGRLSAYHPDGRIAGVEKRLDVSPAWGSEAVVYGRMWQLEAGEDVQVISVIPSNTPFFQPYVAMPRNQPFKPVDACTLGTSFYVAHKSGIHAYAAAGGDNLWSTETDETPQIVPFLDMLLVYHGNTLACVDPGSGDPLIAMEYDNPVTTIFRGVRRNRFFVIEGDNIHAYVN
jgi:hypothetical protein